MSSGDGREGPTGVQNTSTHCAWVGRIHIRCFGPLTDLYSTPRAPKRTRFGLERPFWPNCHRLVQRDDPHPYHVLGPLNGPLWHSWGPQKGPFWPRKALLGAPDVLKGPRGAYFWPNCHWLIRLAEPYPYHVLQPLQRPLRHSWGPQKGNILGKRSLLAAPGVLQTFHTTQMESQQAKCPPSINCLLYGMLYVLTGIY